MRIPACIAFAALLAGCATQNTPQSVPQDDNSSGYSIRFNHPGKVGDRVHVVVTGVDEETTTTTIDHRVMLPETAKTEVEVEADLELLAITKLGYSKRVRILIHRAVCTKGGRTWSFLSQGTEIIAESKGRDTVYFRAGVKVPAAIGQLLGTAGLEVSHDGDVHDDDVFGTMQRKNVGDSWSINSKAAAADLRRQGIPCSPKDISGTVTLEKVVQVDGKDMLRVSGDLVLEGPLPPAPGGLKAKSFVARARYSGLFSVDPNVTCPESQISMEMIGVFEGSRNGHTMTLKMEKRRTQSGRASSL